MQQSSLAIIRIAGVLTIISVVFFLSLLVHIPFVLTVMIVIAGAVVLWRITQKCRSGVYQRVSAMSRLPAFVLTAGLALLCVRGVLLAKKYGGWDAWAIWNFHARYLTLPEHWQQVYSSGINSHPDYPLGLPAIIAFLWKCTGGYPELAPFLFSVLILLLIVSFLFLEAGRIHPLIAAGVLVFMLVSDPFVENAVSQYADTLLGFFIMCTLACVHYFRQSGNKHFLVIAGMLTGAALWTKNEGVLFGVILVLFLLLCLPQKKNLLIWLIGFALPATVWMIHKGMAPGNDLMHQQAVFVARLTDYERGWTILEYFFRLMGSRFLPLTLLLTGVLLWHVFRKRTLPAEIWIIVCCMTGFLSIYQITPHDLTWHLDTSLERLVHQLLPATVYVLITGFPDKRLRASLMQ